MLNKPLNMPNTFEQVSRNSDIKEKAVLRIDCDDDSSSDESVEDEQLNQLCVYTVMVLKVSSCRSCHSP